MKSALLCSAGLMFLLLGFQSVVSALEAPYLISVVPQSDLSIVLNWRNTDNGTQGYILHRKDSTEQMYHPIDTIQNNVAIVQYTDRNNLKPQTRYSYQVRAYNESSISDTSNHLEVITLEITLEKAIIKVFWNSDTSNSVQVDIQDRSKYESGFCVFRKETNKFQKMVTITNSDPTQMEKMSWYDTSVNKNTWYSYQVAVYREGDTVFSDTANVYTFALFHPTSIKKLTKVSEFPLSVSGWTAKAGDSIILKESSAPEDKYSVINIHDPKSPEFAGYIDSLTLLTYPVSTLIPGLLHFNVKNSLLQKEALFINNQIILITGNTLKRYIPDKSFTLIDTLSFTDKFGMCTKVLALNDTVVCVYGTNQSLGIGFYLVKINDSGMKPLKNPFGSKKTSGAGAESNIISNPQGLINSTTVLITSDYKSVIHINEGLVSREHTVYAYDIVEDRLYQKVVADSFSETNNTGCYISLTENINLSNKGELFISDVRNHEGYQTARKNNALYNGAGTPENIFADTVQKYVYVVSASRLTILSYADAEIGIRKVVQRNNKNKEMMSVVPSNSVGVKFLVAGAKSNTGSIGIYDLSGKMVDNIYMGNKNEIYWKPDGYGTRYYIAVATFGKERLISRFVLGKH